MRQEIRVLNRPAILRMDPAWDDPRFENIVARGEGSEIAMVTGTPSS